MARRLNLIALAFAAALSACASLSTPAAPEMDVAVHKGDFAEIQQFTTPGGASVWLVSEPSIPILSVEYAWKGGDVADPAGLEGLASAAVYMMNEGAGDMDSLAFQTRMEELNMSFGCSTSDDWTSCSATMLTENMREASALVSQAFAAPRFDAAPFERFQRENEVALKTRETNAGYLVARARGAAMYPGHPYTREMSAASLAAMTPARAKAQARNLMPKDRLIVTAVGAVSATELAALVDQMIAGLSATSTLPATPDIQVSAAAPASPIIINLPQPQSLVSFTGPGLKFEDPQFFPAFVLNYTLGGGGFASRLMETLREEKGLTYGISTALSDGDHLQTWGGGGQTKNESAGEFITGIRAELSKMRDAGVSADDLADAKAYLTGSYPLSFDSNAKIAGQMMAVRQRDRGVDYFDRRNAMIEAVTLEQVNSVAKTWLDPSRFHFFVAGQPQGLAPAPLPSFFTTVPTPGTSTTTVTRTYTRTVPSKPK